MTLPTRIAIGPLGWVPPDAIDVGPTTPWRNPFVPGNYVIGSDGKALAVLIQDAAHATRLYREMLTTLGPADAITLSRKLEALRGMPLACTCPLDQACHADELLRLANQ